MRYRVGDIVTGYSKESYMGASGNQYMGDVLYRFRVRSVRHNYLVCELEEEGMFQARINLYYLPSVEGSWTVQDPYLENLNKVLSE